MIFSALLYLGLFLALMRLLTWVSRVFPRGRNPAALIVEALAVFAVAEALAIVASDQPSRPIADATVKGILLLGMAGATHFLAHLTATATWPLILPYLLGGLVSIAMLGATTTSAFIAVALVALGGTSALVKHQSLRSKGRAPSQP